MGKLLRKWPPPKNKLSKASSTKSGRLMMLIRVENSIRKRPRNSSRTPTVTSDPEMNSPAKPSMRTTPELLRSPRWLSSSSNSSVDNDHLFVSGKLQWGSKSDVERKQPEVELQSPSWLPVYSNS